MVMGLSLMILPQLAKFLQLILQFPTDIWWQDSRHPWVTIESYTNGLLAYLIYQVVWVFFLATAFLIAFCWMFVIAAILTRIQFCKWNGYWLETYLNNLMYPFQFCCHLALMALLPAYFYSNMNQARYRQLVAVNQRQQPDRPRENKTKNLSKHAMKYKKISKSFSDQFECAICWQTFEKSSKVLQLQCSPMHVFHLQCMESHLKYNQQRECPLCRSEVRFD